MGINHIQKYSPGRKNFSKKSRDPKLGVISWALYTIMSVEQDEILAATLKTQAFVPLADGTALDAYKLNDGAKLHLMIKDNKAAASPSDNSNSVRKKTPVVAAVNLEEELSRSLRDE